MDKIIQQGKEFCKKFMEFVKDNQQMRHELKEKEKQQLLDNIIKRADELKLYDLDDFEIEELREAFAILDLIVTEWPSN